jgi:hypothetical protein
MFRRTDHESDREIDSSIAHEIDYKIEHEIDQRRTDGRIDLKERKK